MLTEREGFAQNRGAIVRFLDDREERKERNAGSQFRESSGIQ